MRVWWNGPDSPWFLAGCATMGAADALDHRAWGWLAAYVVMAYLLGRGARRHRRLSELVDRVRAQCPHERLVGIFLSGNVTGIGCDDCHREVGRVVALAGGRSSVVMFADRDQTRDQHLAATEAARVFAERVS